jgi:hypothetical protein
VTPLALAAALVLVQGGAEVTASVNRTRLTVGEELMLTVRARTRSTDIVEILLPPLTGFAIMGSRDLTEVAMTGTSGGAIRTTVRELQLRAEQPGALLIGPVRARQGRSVVSTDPILITVDSAANRFAAALSPLALRMLETAPPPGRLDRVALTVLASDDTVVAGQQLDVIAAAWIPRDLRERMRRLPVLTLVPPEGVWAYPATAPAGIAASRLVGGRWMDLFITHQTVFPLAAGRIIVPPASVEYALPVTFSFFSREERYSLRSDTVRVAVLPLPATANPTDVVGQGLTLELRIDPLSTRVGEPVEASATLTGMGNVALWPEPVLRWPAGFRAYPAQTEVRLAPRSGRIAGSKTFRFLAVPDSAGSFVLPDVRYSFYDVAAGSYAVAAAAPRVLTVAPGVEPLAARSLPPLLRAGGSLIEARADRAFRATGWIGGVALLVLPPLVVWLVRRRRVPAAALAPHEGAHLTALGRLEREFLGILASHVPDAFARDGDGLAQALRAAGVDGAVADHVKRLRDRLRAARYGPRGLGDAAELAAEIRQVLHVLGADGGATGSGSGGGHWRRRAFVVLVACAALPTGTSAQAPGAEALYEAGALRAAADSFAQRAAREPRDAAHWYNLGATLYRAGADGKATAAWMLAVRIAPRDAAIRRVRRLVAAPDPATEQLLRVGWATPAEWAAVAAVAWLGLWIAALRRNRRWVLMALLGAVAVGAAAAGAVEWRRRARPLAVVVTAAAPVRAAPYGGASAATTIQGGGALLVGRSHGRWREVSRPDGVRGWVLATEIVAL